MQYKRVNMNEVEAHEESGWVTTLPLVVHQGSPGSPEWTWMKRDQDCHACGGEGWADGMVDHHGNTTCRYCSGSGKER